MAFARILSFGVMAVGLFVVGCGSNAPPAPKASEVAFQGTTPEDRQKVEELLKKQGINGEIVTLFKNGDEYSVMVGQKVTPGKRNSPSPPTNYTVNAKAGTVKKAM